MDNTQKEAYMQMQKSSDDYVRSRNKKLLIIIVIIILIITFIKIFFGIINIEVTIPYSNPSYNLFINDEQVMLIIENRKTTTIIPFLVKLTNYSVLLTQGKSGKYITELNQEISLKIDGYKCFSNLTGKTTLSSCQYNNEDVEMEEIENIDYSMKITKNTKVIYKGVYVEEIGEFLDTKGRYQVIITGKYDNIESDLLFLIDIE